MAIPPQRPRTARPGRGPVLSIGRRVFVHCPGDPARGVILTDDAGQEVLPRLADGAPVEVIAWLPRGGASTRYRVRSASGQVDGWLGAAELRATEELGPPVAAPAPEPERPLPRTATADSGRKFGQRS